MNKKLLACGLVSLGFSLSLLAMNVPSQGTGVAAQSTMPSPLKIDSIKSALMQLYQELSIARADVERLKSANPESLSEADKAQLALVEQRVAQLQKEILGRKAVMSAMINLLKKAPNS